MKVETIPSVEPESISARTQLLRPRTGLIRVVLPAYNEEKSLPLLLERLELSLEEAGLIGDVLVVNDGSTDNTAAVVRGYVGQSTVRLLDLRPNQGLAEAIKVGLFAAVFDSKPGDVIITMDADTLTHQVLFSAW